MNKIRKRALWLCLIVACLMLAGLIVANVQNPTLTMMEMVVNYPWPWIVLGAVVWGMVFLLRGEK